MNDRKNPEHTWAKHDDLMDYNAAIGQRKQQ